jgi:lipopolysaccharide biosynthesis glycosyltransferase
LCDFHGSKVVLPILSVCWVTTNSHQYINELLVSVFSSLSHLDPFCSFRLRIDLFFFKKNGRFTFNSHLETALRLFAKISTTDPLFHHVINNSFVFPLNTIHVTRRFPLIVTTRLFLLRYLNSQWVLSSDADLTVVRPFLNELSSHVRNNPASPIFAFRARSAFCPKRLVWHRVNRFRQSITLSHRNSTLYFGGGLLLFPNCHLARVIPDHVIEMTAKRGSPFPCVEQDALWAFSNSSVYGILPWSFNCQMGGICGSRCFDDVGLVHARQGLERDRVKRQLDTFVKHG